MSHENILNEQLPRILTRNVPNVPNVPNVSGLEMINVVNVQETEENSQITWNPKVLNLPKKTNGMTSMPNVC